MHGSFEDVKDNAEFAGVDKAAKKETPEIKTDKALDPLPISQIRIAVAHAVEAVTGSVSGWNISIFKAIPSAIESLVIQSAQHPNKGELSINKGALGLLPPGSNLPQDEQDRKWVPYLATKVRTPAELVKIFDGAVDLIAKNQKIGTDVVAKVKAAGAEVLSNNWVNTGHAWAPVIKFNPPKTAPGVR